MTLHFICMLAPSRNCKAKPPWAVTSAFTSFYLRTLRGSCQNTAIYICRKHISLSFSALKCVLSLPDEDNLWLLITVMVITEDKTWAGQWDVLTLSPEYDQKEGPGRCACHCSSVCEGQVAIEASFEVRPIWQFAHSLVCCRRGSSLMLS